MCSALAKDLEAWVMVARHLGVAASASAAKLATRSGEQDIAGLFNDNVVSVSIGGGVLCWPSRSA